MIIKSATRLALAAGCLTAIVSLSTADAQMGAPGGYGYAPSPGGYGYAPAPGSYGYGPPPSPYGYGPPPSAYGYGPPQGTYPHQEPMARRQAPMTRGQAPMPPRPSMSRRPPQARPGPTDYQRPADQPR